MGGGDRMSRLKIIDDTHHVNWVTRSFLGSLKVKEEEQRTERWESSAAAERSKDGRKERETWWDVPTKVYRQHSRRRVNENPPLERKNGRHRARNSGREWDWKEYWAELTVFRALLREGGREGQVKRERGGYWLWATDVAGWADDGALMKSPQRSQLRKKQTGKRRGKSSMTERRGTETWRPAGF